MNKGEIEEIAENKPHEEEDDLFKELDENTINMSLKDHEQPSRKNSEESKQSGEEENKEEAIKEKEETNFDLGGQFKQYLKVN